MKVLLKKILPVAFLAVLFSNCKKQLLDINTDPNNPTTASADPSLVLPAALNNTAAIYSNPTADARFAFAGLWLGHISYSGNYAIATENISYAITNNFAAAAFGNIYDNLEDYDFVQKKGAQIGNKFYTAVGTLMKAYNYQTLVDLYNNVPYSEALQGTVASKPKYDDAKAIYDDLSKQIDTAIALLKTTATGTLASGDILFHGDGTKWLKFAYTVKLRLLLRQSERTDRASYIQTEVAKLAGAAFLDVDATVNPGFLNSAGKTNPFWGSNINTSGTYTQD
ncbi:MAG TPA: SusD/RagB family nutrient-binding outer membrane lipoprotein, partial [Chitinophagaceae bacterium]|nr:SusD/RagB family nutrient-binding outer membrane lipoprotein [Chitinophagaceae bacterium]